jgi:hypothetical protein
MHAMASLPKGRTLIPTSDAARILGVSMGRIRQLVLLGPDNGGLRAWHVTSKALVLDEGEVLKFAKRSPKGGRPRGGFQAN